MSTDKARLERGKGKRKQSIEIVRHGSLLRMQEIAAGDARLPGYRRFDDEASARAGLAAEVRARLADGMQPADDGAREIAAALPAKPSGPPILPVRRDLAIYNEATGMVITSRRMAGKALEEGSAEWNKAVARGDMLPLTLVQDDSFVIRVVAGEPLTEQEEAEWVARVDSHLNVSDGRLCITGGSVFTTEGYDPDDPSYEEFVAQVNLPKGRYRAALYTHVHGVNGGAVLDHLAGGYDKGEALDAWFARTRPGESPRDPQGGELELVDFLLHLTPIDAAPKTGLSPLPEDGWFSGAENARKPELCPLGLAGHGIVRTARGESTGSWTYVRDVFSGLQGTNLAPVTGTPVFLPIPSLAHAPRVAWFGSRFTTIELRITPPAGGSLDLAGEWPAGVIAVAEHGTGRILFDADLDVNQILPLISELAPRLAALPDGAAIDVCCVPAGAMPGHPEGAGRLWLHGPVKEGTWQLAEAYPQVDGARLSAALALAAVIEGGASIAVQDEAEGTAILKWAKRGIGDHLKGNPPKLADGAIRFKKAGYEVALVGIAAFAHRFSDTWPVIDLTKGGV